MPFLFQFGNPYHGALAGTLEGTPYAGALAGTIDGPSKGPGTLAQDFEKN